MSARDFDLFYDSGDGEPATHRYVTANIDGAQTLEANGTTFDMKLDSALEVGDRVTLTDAAASPDVVTHCVVTGKESSPPTLTLRPLFSDADTGDESGIGHSFPDDSIVVPDVGHDAAVLVIDLSEAPEDEYQFIVFGTGHVSHNTTGPRSVAAWVRRTLVDDPVDGDVYGEARITLPNASGAFSDAYNYVGASHHVLEGGQRYEFRLQFRGIPASGFASRMSNARLLAIRIDPETAYVQGDGKTAEQSTTTTVNHLSHGTNALPSGDFLCIASWCLASDTTTAGPSATVSAALRDVSTFAEAVVTPLATTDWCPFGFFGKISVGSANDYILRLTAGAGATSKMRHACFAFIPVSLFDNVDDHSDNADVTITDGTDWTETKGAGHTAVRARHVETMQFSGRGSNGGTGVRTNFRAKWANTEISNPTGRALHSYPFNNDEPTISTTFLHRSSKAAGFEVNYIEAQTPDDADSTVNLRDIYFTWLRERADLNIKPETPIATIAEVMPAIHIKHMEAGGATDRFKKAFAEIGLFRRVRVNSEDYTEVKSLGEMVAKTWYWDRTARELYIQYPSGDGPSDTDMYTVVQPLLLVGRFHHDVSVDGEYRSYESRIDGVPDATQELTSRDGKYSGGTTLGNLSLTNVDRKFTNLHSLWNWDGWPVRIWQGAPSLSDDIRDFELIADAIMGRPRLPGDSFRVALFDRGQLLRKTVTLATVTAKEGYTGDGNNGPRDREGQELPILYGYHRRVVAYRTQANEGAGQSNQYSFASLVAKSVSAVYATPDSATPIAFTDGAPSAHVTVSNDEFDDPAKPPDLVYVDCLGVAKTLGLGAPYVTVGAIYENVFTIVGGLDSTDLVRVSFRQMDRGGRTQLDLSSGPRPVPVSAALRIDSGERVADVLDRFAGHTGTSWAWNRQGRVYIDVPNFDAGNLAAPNAYFELDDTSPWPMEAREGAVLTVTNTRSFAVGQNSLEISNDSGPNAYAVRKALFPRSGNYVVTLPVLSISGDATAFRIGVLPPDGEEQLSAAHALSTTRWTRVTFPVQIDRGHVGQTELRFYPAKGISTAVVVGIDAIESYHLAAIAQPNNSEVLDVEYEDDDAYEVLVGFDHNSATGTGLVARVPWPEAMGLATTEPEGQHVVGSAGSIDLTDALITDAASAAGVGAGLVSTHGRQRQRMPLIMKNLTRLPILGDRIMHRDHPDVPESPDNHPVWRVVKSRFDPNRPEFVRLTVRRQVDPAADRMEVV